jgi:hypothetical protein
MYAGAEIINDQQFGQAVLISAELARARDLSNPLSPAPAGLTDLHLRTIYSLLCRLWAHAGRIVKDRSAAVQFQMGLLADSMRFFLYRARNIYSKRWALSTSVMLLESILWQEKRIHVRATTRDAAMQRSAALPVYWGTWQFEPFFFL